MKYWYKYFVYLSLVFLAVALYKANYLKVPRVFSFFALGKSILFLFTGFTSQVISWKKILEKSNYHVALSECLAGSGLSIFGKYIPGKIWIIIGRAAYIAEKNHYPIGKLSVISLNAQFITLWLGLIFGAIGLFLLGGFYLWGWLILLLLLTLTFIIFSKFAHDIAEHLIGIVFGKEVELPRLNLKSTLSVMPWFGMIWIFYSIGFYMLVISLTSTNIAWSAGFGFPLSVSLGVMAIIAPGGLGIREGVIVGYLTLAGLPVAEAVIVAIASRLWFLLGEVFMFIVGWISDRMSRGVINRARCEAGVSAKHLLGEREET